MTRIPTSGTELIDTLIDGVHVGDNLVFQGPDGAPLDLLVDRFVAAVGEQPLVLVRLGGLDRPVPEGATVLDWSPALSGRVEQGPQSLAPGAELADALAMLRATDDRVGTGAAFVFDELSVVEQAWGPDAALELFLTACPRLYRRRSLAIWPVRTAAHRPSFLRRLREITQVVVEFDEDDRGLRLEVRKADGRDERVVGRSVHAEVVDGDLRATETPGSSRERLGTAIRDQRLARGASQADVARRVGISPSALSQIERGVRGPSGDTLVRLWEVLGVPFGPAEDRERGFRVARRSGREQARIQDGMSGEQLLDDPDGGTVWSLEIAPGAAASRAPFAVKTPETVVVLRGVLDLEFAGRTETLHEGDAVVVTSAAVTGWSNPAPSRPGCSGPCTPRPDGRRRLKQCFTID